MRKLLLTLALGALIAPAFATTTPDAAAPLLKATPAQAEAAVWATRFLTRFHYKPTPLDDAMSEKIYKRYLESLDGDKLFFTQADIDKFEKYKDKLDDAIYDQDLGAPYAMFNIYQQRVADRVAYSRALLAKGFDFGVDENYQYDREKAPWAKDAAELDDLWRKRVKNDWLRLKLANKPDKDIRDTLDKRYANYLDRVRQLNSEDVFQTFMNAYASSIEPHTNYLGPRASENFDIAMKLSLEGIGAVLQRDDDYTAIREIVPGGPAALSGKLKVGDRIVGVGQGESGPIVDVVGWRLDDVVEKIRGAKDTVVRLEVLPLDAGPDGKHVTLSLVRKKVSIEEQAAKKSIIDVKEGSREHRIGVISLPTFYQDFEARRRGDRNYKSATRDVERLLGELRADKVDGVIIDLRNNGGGSLAEATDLTGLFIDKGPVVQVRNANGQVEVESDTKGGMAWDGPLGVLVNRASASASEIFAAAIQDYGRGVIIGEPTFGKGTVQNLVDLDEVAHNEKPTFGEVKMTIAQFFRINGGSTQLRGVTPDISFPLTVDAKDFGESSYDNALPWTSIAPAKYKPVADLKPIVPMLIQRHDARIANNVEWKNFEADLADARALRAEKTISLNEAVRRKERDEQEAKRKAREGLAAQGADEHAGSATPSTDPASKAVQKIHEDAGVARPRANAADADAAPKKEAAKALDDAKAKDAKAASSSADDSDDGDDAASSADDGLQPDERNINSDLAREKEAKQRRDVVLDEAAHILADEIGLIRADNKLAQQVLPHAVATPTPAVD
ncbi:carboxy terminal-processing peptidase [Dokdonella sp.]|uniref:carboxy terminal-processing peptidase n=1 Tax=Dokdonella sp. TaxID=2291710 RepID=UPI002616D362|nr:carboxy terminal-processing peptidase [Dokdonella sp.]